MKLLASLAAFSLLGMAVSATPVAAKPVGALSVRPCGVGEISLSFDGENGSFDGMSHGGSLLVLRNIADTACSVPRLPILSFEDAAHRALPIAFKSSVGVSRMVLLPLPLAPGAEATGRMRWVSGDVYDGHNCATFSAVTLTLNGQRATVPFAGQMCGPAGKPIPYTLEWLKPDAVYQPGAS